MATTSIMIWCRLSASDSIADSANGAGVPSMDEQERVAWVRLALTPYVGAESFVRLMRHFGSAEAVMAASAAEIEPHLAHKGAVQYWRGTEALQAAEQALNWEANHADGRLLLPVDADYPPMLSEGLVPPPLLFVRGDVSYLSRPSLSVVGSRHATPQARRIARDFAKAVSDIGVAVVSGMAEGIDTAAHQGALAGCAGTVAVWGTGIDRVYPRGNKPLAQAIAAQGCLVSEFPLGTRAWAGNFPRRNRIIAALSQATLVVEAAPESGSLITARLAADMGREVLAVPGSIDNPHSKGCHGLIKQGAQLTECLEDILQACSGLRDAAIRTRVGADLQKMPMQPFTVAIPIAGAADESDNTGLSAGRHAMLMQMGFDPVHPDELAQRLRIPADEVYAALLEWELSGIVAHVVGGRYQRIGRHDT